MNKKFDLGDIEVTSREIIVSIAIIAAFLIGGFLVSGRIQDSIDDANIKYNTAVKIDCSDSNELFIYGMRTNIGNTFVHGELIAVDPVSYPDIDGEYMEVKKTKERYTRHTRRLILEQLMGGRKPIILLRYITRGIMQEVSPRNAQRSVSAMLNLVPTASTCRHQNILTLKPLEILDMFMKEVKQSTLVHYFLI